MSDADRRAILRRRAAFVGSALAVLSGCTKGTPAAAQPEPPARGVVSVPEPPADAAAPADPLPEPSERARPARAHPPLDTPAGVSDVARQKFDGLRTRMQEVYALLDSTDVPASCDIQDASCDGRWRQLADSLLELEERTRYIVPVCRGSSESAKLYEARATEHAEHVAQLKADIAERIERALDSGGEPAKQRWAQHQRDARRGKPRVCLSFACVDW